MAAGFTPKYTLDYPVTGITQQQFIVLATDAMEKLGWGIGYASNNILVAYTNNGVMARNAEITVEVENAIANIKSASTGNEFFDMGKNRKNVNLFIETLDEI